MTQKTEGKLPRQFDRIILTLENCLLPEDRLNETPSQQDGLDEQVEIDLRILGCELIQIAGILLKLPQVAMATGQVLFQRFYYSKSFLRLSMETTAMSCVCLASKIEEAPRRIRDVINVFHHIKQVRGQKPIQPMILDTNYTTLKTQVIKAERRVLKELGFCVHVKHPHKLIVMYLNLMGYETKQELVQMAWNFMNDSLRTDVFVRYNPESIACACIYLTARKINMPMPSNPPWYGIFDVTEDEILDISYKIMSLYRRRKPNAEALEQAIEELRKKFNDIRNSSKVKVEQIAVTPPMAVTTVDRNDSSHNAWGGFIARAQPIVPTTDNDKTSSQPQQSTQSQGQMHAATTSQAIAQQPQQSHHHHQQQQQQQLPPPQQPLQQTSQPSQNSYAQKRSNTRSRSGSSEENRTRSHKKSRHRSRSRTPIKYSSSSKKRSSRYSKSPSLSPSRHTKKRDRKSPGREKDYYNNGDRNGSRNRGDRDRNHDDHRRVHSRDKRYSGHSGSGSGSNNHRSSKHHDRFRDRKH